MIDDDHPATRKILDAVSANVSWFSYPGEDDYDRTHNFHEATGGRATITMDGLSQLQSRTNAIRVVPGSFGTPPPPIVDHWEFRYRNREIDADEGQIPLPEGVNDR